MGGLKILNRARVISGVKILNRTEMKPESRILKSRQGDAGV